MTWAMHCDAEGCDSWQKGERSDCFVAVIHAGSNDPIAHACCLDCLMRWAAKHSSPTLRLEP